MKPGQIGLALEVPSAYLHKFTQRTDLDFALAHQVLADKYYARWFDERPPHRELILDNSFHELGEPLPLKDLAEAATRVRADYVIAPDRLDDPEWTMTQFVATHVALHPHTKIAVNLVGDTPEDRKTFLEVTAPADMLCLPYRRPRLDWFRERSLGYGRIHLLGVSSLAELQEWAQIARHRPEINFSVDTSKPVKWGIEYIKMDQLVSLRGAPTSSKDLLNVNILSQHQVGRIDYNITVLREILQATE